MNFSAPGRTELAGNHTDHQGGHVLAAAVGVYIFAQAEPNGTDTVNIYSEGFGKISAQLDARGPRESERGQPQALVRGAAEYLKEKGYAAEGFDAKVKSQIAVGSGLASSAAFEVLIGSIISGLFNSGRISERELAAAGRHAENIYFGKPCGMMDQYACALRGIAAMDLSDPEAPKAERIKADFDAAGYSIMLTDTGSDHAGLTEHYAAITGEMRRAAEYFGKQLLSQVDREEFYSSLRAVREKAGDRAVLRAMHWFEEDERVIRMTRALKNGDMPEYIEYMDESGRSSAELLQNSYAVPESQGITLALALSRRILKKKGAARVHGGGFAGTVQAIMPRDMTGEYKKAVEALFGEGSCREIKILY